MKFDLSRTEKRIRAMTEGELLTWLEVALPGMQRHLEAYARSRNLDHLGELAIAETTANLVITELMRRKFESQEALSVASASQTQPDTTSARGSFLRRRRARTGTAPATTVPTTTMDSPTKSEQSTPSASGQ